MIGPAPIQRALRPIRGLGERLASDGPDSPQRLSALGPNLRRAAAAVAKLRAGLARAASGSGLLGAGSERAGDGARALAGALERAAAGGGRASDALERLAAGSERLATGQRTATSAGLALELELRGAASQPPQQGPGARPPPCARTRSGGPRGSLAAGDGTAAATPGSRPRRRARQDQGVARHRDRASRRSRAPRSRRGAARSRHRRARRQRFRTRGRPRRAERRRRSVWPRGSTNSRAEPARSNGAWRTASIAPTRSRRGSAGRPCGSAPRRDLCFAAPRRSATARRTSSTPATSSSPPSTARRRSTAPSPREAVNVEHGGQAARLLVVSTDPFNTAGSRATGAMLRTEAARLGREGDLRAGVSGGAAILNDYASATKSPPAARDRRDHPDHLPAARRDPPRPAPRRPRGRSSTWSPSPPRSASSP